LTYTKEQWKNKDKNTETYTHKFVHTDKRKN